jgi:hypothetical protein
MIGPNYPLDQPLDNDDDTTYTIVRFSYGKPREIIKEGVTLEEAQEHCNRDDSRGMGWFDGWYRED